ncbi:MAG: hypothetical protein LBS54_06490, partial [Dysgonamonadaceae bacterium]|nr:hypothetical protein [Dysgonamonadaceae bacterium]
LISNFLIGTRQVQLLKRFYNLYLIACIDTKSLLKIVRTSFGYRRTITKLTNYFGLMLMLPIADIAASVIFKIPYFTVFGAIGIVIVEAKSVFENLKQE